MFFMLALLSLMYFVPPLREYANSKLLVHPLSWLSSGTHIYRRWNWGLVFKVELVPHKILKLGGIFATSNSQRSHPWRCRPTKWKANPLTRRQVSPSPERNRQVTPSPEYNPFSKPIACTLLFSSICLSTNMCCMHGASRTFNSFLWISFLLRGCLIVLCGSLLLPTNRWPSCWLKNIETA